MYCYFPEKRFGDDKVAWVTGVTGSPGDVLLIDDELALILGEDITAPELIHGQVTAVNITCQEKGVCAEKSLQLIHHFVGKRYTSYAHAIPLWLGNDVRALLKRKKKSSPRGGRAWKVTLPTQGDFQFSAVPVESTQQLLVFPDLRTMHQQLPARIFEQSGVARRHSKLSVLQKATIFRGCKYGSIHTLITTPAGIFQDRYSLSSIALVDAHKWRYKSAQDPRYRTPSVISDMCDTFSCELQTSGVVLS